MLNPTQHTLLEPVSFEGTGLHTGAHGLVKVLPAGPGHGIEFRLATGDRVVSVPASFEYVVHTTWCTTLGRDDATVMTIEHMMAALRAARITNAIVEVQGPEIPILDGSSREFYTLFEKVGLQSQGPAPTLRFPDGRTKVDGDAERYIQIEPAPQSILDYTYKVGATQHRFRVNLDQTNLAGEVLNARTFGFSSRIEQQASAGYIKGLAKGCGFLIDDLGVRPAILEGIEGLKQFESRGLTILTCQELRYPDEFVRHKVLDLIGDLALAPGLSGFRIEACGSGHTENIELLRRLYREKIT